VRWRARGVSVLAAGAGVFLLATASFAVGLSDADFEYLATHELMRDSPVLRGLSPKEQARLHGVINDDRTTADPIGKAHNVAQLLEEFARNQLWERLNPGKLWDAKTR
jgi:hypothetical protein